MTSGRFSKTELVRILETIESAKGAFDRVSLKAALAKAGELVGAQWSICGLVSVNGTSPTGIIEVVNHNYPEEWLQCYTDMGFIRHDPVVRLHARFSAARKWDEAFKAFSDPRARLIRCYASDFGMKTGVATSIYLPERSALAMFAFASDADRFGEEGLRKAEIVAPHLSGALTKATADLFAVDAHERMGLPAM